MINGIVCLKKHISFLDFYESSRYQSLQCQQFSPFLRESRACPVDPIGESFRYIARKIPESNSPDLIRQVILCHQLQNSQPG